jgi:hypothetical protein
LIDGIADALGDPAPEIEFSASGEIVGFQSGTDGLRFVGTFLQSQVADSNGDYWSVLPHFVATANSLDGTQVPVHLRVKVIDSASLDEDRSIDPYHEERRVPSLPILRADVASSLEAGVRNSVSRQLTEVEGYNVGDWPFSWLGPEGEVWPVYHFTLRDEERAAKTEVILGPIVASLGLGLLSLRGFRLRKRRRQPDP